MKKLFKKPISMALSLAVLVSSITCISSISFLSASADSIDKSLSKTFSYTNFDEFSTEWAAIDSSKADVNLALNSGISVNDNIAPSADQVVQDIYKQYNIASKSNSAFVYATESNPLYVDWQEDTVTSVEYTILTPALYGNAVNYYFPIGATDDKVALIAFEAMSGTPGNVRIAGRGVTGVNPNGKFFSDGYQVYDNDTTSDEKNASNLVLWQENTAGQKVLSPRGNHKPYAAEVKVKIEYSKDSTKTNGVYNYYATKVTFTATDDSFKIVESGHEVGFVNNSVTASITKDWSASNDGTGSAAITDARLMLPNGPSNNAGVYYSGICIKGVTVNYTEGTDKYISDFLAAYAKIENKTTGDITIEDKDDVQNVLNIYNGYNEIYKGYVGDIRIAHTNELMAKITELEAQKWLEENYAAKVDAVKTAGVFNDNFSVPALSAAVWNIDYFTSTGYKLAGGSSLSNVNIGGNKLATYFDLDEVGNPTTGGLTFSDGKATKLIQGKSATSNTNARLFAEAMRSYINPEILPADINTISGTFELKPGRYSFLFGENSNMSTLPAYDKDGDGKNDLPTYGMAVNIDSNGYVSVEFMNLGYQFTDSTEYVSVKNSGAINFKDGSYFTSLVKAYNTNSKALDMNAGSVKISFSFAQKTTEYNGTSYTYMQPTITVSAGDVTISDTPATKAVYSLNGVAYDSFPTAITGYSFGFTQAVSSTVVYAPSVWMDDIEIIGAAAPRVNGASIKKTNDADKQDIRFSINVASNEYLTNKGYAVKNYGVVVALYDALADKNAELTSNSAYSEAYNGASPVTKIKETTELPTGEVFVNIGESAAGAERLGLRYIVRPFVTYTKDGTDLVVYATDNSVGENGTCVRSIYSTGKKIAKAIQGKSGFVAEENYAVGEDSISYATVSGIIDGTASGNSKTVITDTNATYGQALLAFTAKHNSLLS